MSEAYGRSNVDIMAVGLVCPLGRHALQAALLARAGRRFVRPLPQAAWSGHEDGSEATDDVAPAATEERAPGPEHRPRVSYVSDLPAGCVGFERMMRLAVPALRQLGIEPDAPPIPLLIALPPAGRADDDDEAAAAFAAELGRAASLTLDVEQSHTTRGGQASAARLAALGAELIEAGRASAVVVGGVDSYLHPALLRELAAAGRIIGFHRSEGFMPSEAAAFVLLGHSGNASYKDAQTSASAPDGATHRASPSLARLCCAQRAAVPVEVLAARAEQEAVGGAEKVEHPSASRHARGPGVWLARGAVGRSLRRLGLHPERLVPRRYRSYSRRGRPSRGPATREEQTAAPDVTDTMTELIERVAAEWPGVPIEWVLTDRNFTSDRAHQWSTASLRALPPGVSQDHYAELLGDVGAATVPTLMALACASWASRSASAGSALVAVHSDDGERGALLLREAR